MQLDEPFPLEALAPRVRRVILNEFQGQVYLGRAVDHLRRQGRIIRPEVLKHVSPLSWEHINLTGTYAWGE